MRIAREVMVQWQSVAGEGSLSSGLIPPRDYTGLELQDAQLRIWLPDQARQALSEVSLCVGVSMTVYLTELFATYLYGIHEVLRMRHECRGMYYTGGDATTSDFAFDEGAQAGDEPIPELEDPVPEMGKNIFALKIFLPSKIKQGLEHRAAYAQVPLGRFARALICAHLFGRDIGEKKLMSAASEDA